MGIDPVHLVILDHVDRSEANTLENLFNILNDKSANILQKISGVINQRLQIIKPDVFHPFQVAALLLNRIHQAPDSILFLLGGPLPCSVEIPLQTVPLSNQAFITGGNSHVQLFQLLFIPFDIG